MKGRAVLTVAAVALVMGWLIVPKLFRHLDGTLSKAAEQEILFHDMTNAYGNGMAGELPPDHPTARRWKECKSKLLQSGYLMVRELPLQDPLSARGATWTFFKAFQTNFPGVECSLRRDATNRAVAIITAPKADFGLFGDIEAFVRRYQHEVAPKH